MFRSRLITTRFRLISALALLLLCGFAVTSWLNYVTSYQAIRQAIISDELPLTADNIYSEIQKDLLQPLLISSMMARDTFVRDWTLSGEQDVSQMSRYLQEIRAHYGAFSAFFVSEQSRNYYHPGGVLKQVKADEPRDRWFFRVRELKAPYEINVDPDLANRDALTIFINYRVFDFEQKFIGATGIGLTLDTVNHKIEDYEARFDRRILLVDSQGQVMVAGRNNPLYQRGQKRNLSDIKGLSQQAAALLASRAGTFEYRADGRNHYANVRYLPELQWHLLVIKSDSAAVAELRRIFIINLLCWLLICVVVLWLVQMAIGRYQARLEHLSMTDPLTGMSNRRALDLLLEQAACEARRQSSALTLLLLDIDHFKQINERIGHLGGDQILRQIGRCLRFNLRKSDILCRWGGEEFLIVLKQTTLTGALQVADHLRQQVEALPLSHQGNPLQATLSIGISLYRHGEPLDNLIARADSRLYRAKLEGRNRVCADLGDEPLTDDGHQLGGR